MSESTFPLTIWLTKPTDGSTPLEDAVSNCEDIRYWHEVHSTYRRVEQIARRATLYESALGLLETVGEDLQALHKGVITVEGTPMLAVDWLDRDEPLDLPYRLAAERRFQWETLAEANGFTLDATTLDGSLVQLYDIVDIQIPHDELELKLSIRIKVVVFAKGPRAYEAVDLARCELRDYDYWSDGWQQLDDDQRRTAVDTFFGQEVFWKD